MLGSWSRCTLTSCRSWVPSTHLVVSSCVKVMLAKVRSLTEDFGQVGHIRFPLLELDFFCDEFLCNLLFFTFLFQKFMLSESS